MKYLITSSNILDVTKPPYNADNTGKTNCTAVLRQAMDDCLKGYIDALEVLRRKLLAEYEKSGENVYAGAEAGRVVDGKVFMTMPEEIPSARIIYFPAGTYLVSDTISYTFDNLKAPQTPAYTCELCRNIHILGEDMENTVIRLADNSRGFDKGKKKAVISFNTSSIEDRETTNCAQMNTLEDITIDCGNGNDGAIGVAYSSSNSGRIENVEIKGENGFCGINFDYGSECCVENIKISGFEYGIKTGHTSPIIIQDADLSRNRIAGIFTKNANICCRRISACDIPLFFFEKSELGRYYIDNKAFEYAGDMDGNFVFYEETPQDVSVPKNVRSTNPDDLAFVEDFGAVGDGRTDSTVAIQKAMDSGKSVILFGSGTYFINKCIKIPATVRTIDFMYSRLLVGQDIVVGSIDCVFDIYEDSDTTLFIENLDSNEKFAGFFRCFKHSAKRTAVFKDINIAASLYFNTVYGSKVYIDNCFTHTNHYSQDAVLHRDGYIPVFCRMIPVEFHNQEVYARNLNIERADIELLNDNSKLLIDGYKVEGPGVLVKTVNGGKTQINLFNAAWWGNKIRENALFEISDSKMRVCGGHIFCYSEDKEYRLAVSSESEKTYLDDCSKVLPGRDSLGRETGRIIENIKINI